MIKSGPAKKLTIYVDENEKVHGKPVYEAVLDILAARKISGASVFRGSRVTESRQTPYREDTRTLYYSSGQIEVVDTEGMINIVLAEISSVVGKGLIEVSDTVVIKSAAQAVIHNECSSLTRNSFSL
jgi:PII-like signaling protein